MGFWSWIGLADRKDILSLQSEIVCLREENKLYHEENCKLINEIQKANENNFDKFNDYITSENKIIDEKMCAMRDILIKIENSLLNAKEEIIDLNKSVINQIELCKKILENSNQAMHEYKDSLNNKLETEFVKLSRKIESEKQEINENINKGIVTLTKGDEKITNEIIKTMSCIKKGLGDLKNQISEKNNSIENASLLLIDIKNRIDELNDLSQQIGHKTNDINKIQENILAVAGTMKDLWVIMKAIWVDSVLSDIDEII